MILSMTGYGKATAEFRGKKITAEVKSLNSKALDMSTRIAPLYREKELDLRAMLTATLERGKVDFSLWAEQTDMQAATPISTAFRSRPTGGPRCCACPRRCRSPRYRHSTKRNGWWCVAWWRKPSAN